MPLATRTRLVRRAPLLDRVAAYLNPLDFLLWLSEELNSNDWDDFEKTWSIPAGIAMNLAFIIARSNSRVSASTTGDDVFGDFHVRRGSGWLPWLASFLVHFLALVSFANAVYIFTRRRHYRFFETPLSTAPQTPSARCVPVDSSPLSSSPLRLLSTLLASTSAASRAHPDPARDVWQLAIWDPTPLCLRLFWLFSPGHVLLYALQLPTARLDPHPSVTVTTTLALALLMSAQLWLLQHHYTRQAADARLLHREVLHEYDTKYVRPTLSAPVRDVGTQVFAPDAPRAAREVHTYAPATYVNRGFRTHPNTNYAPLYDPHGLTAQPPVRSFAHTVTRANSTPNFRVNGTLQLPSSATRHVATAGDGGSFGIHSHAYSPIKRATAVGPAASGRRVTDFGSPSAGAFARQGSPLKRSSGVDGVAQSREGEGGASDLGGRSGGGGGGVSALNRRFGSLR